MSSLLSQTNRINYFYPIPYRTEQAIVPNEVVFASTSLTVLAAPWGYAFCSKLHRLSGARDQTKDTDVQDAVVYERKYLETKRLSVFEWRKSKCYARTIPSPLNGVTEDAIIVP